ncbi:MAG TPA: asparagine synthase (glutamine-hydrolyzing) [Vicinamibacterales bacterium]|nr:asparagine synthase (glutamine-hydrolyzing) [Vicinamibacterales bacterium]
MCGIAGIVAREPGARVDERRLARMRDALRHRGPDGSGLLVDGPVGLVHTRLAIVDVARGEQPMSNESGDVWVVFNGEIYNHADLRPGLEAAGHRYRTRCDTETIVHLYEEQGEDVVDALRGMFAFAIWDRPRQRLLLARDRLGIKPLYYRVADGELLFASEIKALLAASAERVEFNDAVLPEFLSTRFVSGEETFFRGVRKLLPGHVLTWSPGEPPRTRRYWQLPAPVPAGAAPSSRDLRARLEAAVSSHLMSDVPLGVFLSGGIDSSALAAMAARQSSEPLQTFAVGFAEAEANELPYARLVADHIGATHREVTVTPESFFEALPHALWHEDEPMAFSSSVPLFLLARLAREHVKVVLTGEGADELFLGYNRYRVTNWNARFGRPYWAAMPGAARRVIRDAVQALPAPLARVARRSFLGLEPGIRGVYHENFAVFPLHVQQRLLRRRDLLDGRDPYATQTAYFDEASGSLLDRIGRAELRSYLLELLMKQDQMSMASSIESRVPFLDDRLVEHVVAMPGDVKLPGWTTKVLLREAVRDLLPAPILTRRKMGFPVPLGDWLRGRFAPVVDEFVLGPRAAARGYFDRDALRRLVLEHGSRRVSHTDALWLLVNFEIWQRVFVDGEAPGDVMDVLAVPRAVAAPHSTDLASCAFSG